MNFSKVGVALQLAEDWFHFPTVLQVFEDQGDTEMLRKYLEVFKDKGFDESLFRYYLDNSEYCSSGSINGHMWARECRGDLKIVLGMVLLQQQVFIIDAQLVVIVYREIQAID